ncbi:MAG: hypothetical protein U0521_02665 [Anaerolineae bacterium]
MRDVSVVGPLNIDLLIKGDGPPDWDRSHRPVPPRWMTAAGSGRLHRAEPRPAGLSVRVSSPARRPAWYLHRGYASAAGVDTGSVRRVPGTLGGIGVYALLGSVRRKRPPIYRLPTIRCGRPSSRPTKLSACSTPACCIRGYLHHRDARHGALRATVPRGAGARGWIEQHRPAAVARLPCPGLLRWSRRAALAASTSCSRDGEGARAHRRECVDAGRAQQPVRSCAPKTVTAKQGADGSRLSTVLALAASPVRDYWSGRSRGYHRRGRCLRRRLPVWHAQGWRLEDRALFASVAAGFTVIGVGGAQTIRIARHPCRDGQTQVTTIRSRLATMLLWWWVS